MYQPPIDIKAKEAELKLIGYRLEDFAADDEEAFAWRGVDVWAENTQSFEVFSALSTQWRTGMNGATGMDYTVLPELWRRLKVPVSKRDDVFNDIRIMESAALAQMNENQASMKANN